MPRSANNQLVELLVLAPVFRAYQRAFEDATGLPLTLRAVENWQLAHSDSRNQNPFCALMSQSNRSCAACLHIQQRVCAFLIGLPCTMGSSCGLREIAVALRVGQAIIASKFKNSQ